MGTIRVTNLGKVYKQYSSPLNRLLEWITPWPIVRHTEKWAIQDVNFTVEPGEAVGIIGVNGAGKSTLLKMITGTTQPTTGQVSMTGKVAALLELGMGFHPDFTGRQNVQMAAQLVGYTAKEIEEYIPAIEAFAEIGDVMDQTIRTYSSGMQMRLAFSVATAKRPDILIVDEALSVGDAYFQHKSFQRIRQFQQEGTTLLFVSHDPLAIQSICDRAVLLHGGKMVQEGTPAVIMDHYNALIAQSKNNNVQQIPIKKEEKSIQTISGTGEASIESVALLDQDNKLVEEIEVGQQVKLKVNVQINAPVPKLILGYLIRDRVGQTMYGTNTHYKKLPLHDLQTGEKLEYILDFPANLGPGSYSVSINLIGSENHLTSNYEWRDLALIFHVANINKTHFAGCNWMEPRITVQREPNQ
jgi:lipopolysaccharide transport system ATP-binding protein